MNRDLNFGMPSKGQKSNAFQSPERCAAFLQKLLNTEVQDLHFVNAGWHSRAFAFQANGHPLILKVAREAIHVHKEKWARQYLGQAIGGPALPIPAVFLEGLQDGFSWCIQARCPGHPLAELSPSEQMALAPDIHRLMLSLHIRALPTGFRGYGIWSLKEQRGHTSWRKHLGQVHGFAARELPAHSPLRTQGIWVQLQQELLQLLAACPEQAWWLHGDCKTSNLLGSTKGITGWIDWATLGWGDFVYDWAVFVLYAPRDSAWPHLQALSRLYRRQGFELPQLTNRLRASLLHAALGALFMQEIRQQARARQELLQQLRTLLHLPFEELA